MGVGRLSRSELLTHRQCPCACQNIELWECPSSPPSPIAQACTVPTWGRKDRSLAKYFNRMCWQLLHGFLDLVKDGLPHPTGGWQPGRPIKSPPEESSSLSALPPPAHIGPSSCRNDGSECPVSGPCPAWGPEEPGPGFNSELDPCPIFA